MDPIRHGSESFFIEGEGLLTTQLGGRVGDQQPDPVDESGTRTVGAPALVTAEAVAPPFRFSRVGPKGTRLGAAVTRKLALAMVKEGGGDGDIPAGYTYLGQFIDHDLTMDRTSVILGEDVRPVDMLQGRSPRLDLDSVYGNGPGDALSAKFYGADGLHLQTGATIAARTGRREAATTCRGWARARQAAKRMALIPDPRNDENLIVAQTHLAMIHFHNRVLDKVPASVPDTAEVHPGTQEGHAALPVDDPPRLPAANLPPRDARRRLHQRPQTGRAGGLAADVPTMPVEFSVAAFRLGHSMIRPAYNWNQIFSGTAGSWTTCSISPAPAATWSATCGCPATGSPTGAACTTSRRAAGRGSSRASHVNHADAHRHAAHRPAEEPAPAGVRRLHSNARSTTCAETWPSAT